jgi:hypothetical protein
MIDVCKSAGGSGVLLQTHLTGYIFLFRDQNPRYSLVTVSCMWLGDTGCLLSYIKVVQGGFSCF